MSNQRIIKYSALGLGIMLFIITSFSSCAVVPPGFRGIRVTLGSVSKEQLSEGVHFKLPFISQIKLSSIQQTTYNGITYTFSSDLQNVTVSYSLMWKIPENKVVELFRGYAGAVNESLILPRISEAIKQVTALYRAEEIVKIREKIRNESYEIIVKKIGDLLIIADLNITNIDLSDEVEHSIEQKVVQEQLALAKTFELQKEQKEAEITMVKARAEAESVKIRGEALKNSPQVIELEIIKKWNGQSPSTVVVGQGGASVVFPIRRFDDK